MVAAAIIGGSIVAGGTALIASGKQAKAAREAGELGFEASQASIEEQRRQFDIAQQLTAPRRAAEEEALNSLRALLGLGGEAPDPSAFAQTPGFQFTREEALRATERSASARGGLVSGNTLAELQGRAAGLAGQNFLQSFLQPTLALATGGAAAQQGQNALNLGVNVGQTITQGAAARASGITGAAEAQAGGLAALNQVIQGGLSNFLLQRQLGSGGTAGFNPGFGQTNQGFPTAAPSFALNLGGP